MARSQQGTRQKVTDLEVMQSIVDRLQPRISELSAAWHSARPFPYIVVDDFLPTDFGLRLLEAFPSPAEEEWQDTTYRHQRNKLSRETAFPEPIDLFFRLTAWPRFRDHLSAITGIADLLDDPDLVGGGCHQILAGGFLDVHVDFNLHPKTKLHRRLNLLVYLNQDWSEEWGGSLELWDMENQALVEKVPPIFNRAVLFETSEVSYHGHPHPLKTPDSVTRKSLAVYYYTRTPGTTSSAPEHNTVYRQTTGLQGYLKTTSSSLAAASERLRSEGGVATTRDVGRKIIRKLRGLPQENR